jgi:uncharacterized membrane protein
MHHHTLSNLTPIETIFAIAAVFLILYIYFLPIITAIKKNSPNKTAVVIVNIFFGVTLIGWLVALLLASKQPHPVVVVYNTPPPPSENSR